MGTAGLVLVLTAVLCTTIWWSVRAVSAHESAVDESRAALRESETRVAAMLETIADGFASFDKEWRFTYINGPGARLLRRDPAALIGRSVWEVFPEVVGSSTHSALHEVADGRTMVDVVHEDPARGRTFWNRAYPTAGGGVSVHFRDITDQKRAEETLREADRRKDEFLATLAHELRNPLAPLRNSLELVKRLKDRPDLIARSIEMMERQVRTMVRLIDDLLDVSRITRNKLELRREPVDLASVAQQALEAARAPFEAAGHRVTVSLPPDPIRLHADPTRLAQVFGNLLQNAFKYTEPGGEIRLSLTREGDEAVVKVADTGVGIPADMLPRVFELFMQVDHKGNHSGEGLGIGLSLVKRLVELHGGTVSAHSDGQGRGSEFTLRLPVHDGATPGSRARGPSEETSGPPGRLCRILVVDDNKDSAESLALLLGVSGHQSEVAHDGEQAVEKSADFMPDIILLDIGLPGMDGYETCRTIRAQPWGRNVLVVAVTGWGQPEDRRRSREAGFNAHLVKPVDPRELVRVLASAGQGQPAV
jgi:PAS domain S-box-containing protein